MVQLWSRGGLSWKDLLKRTARHAWNDEIFGQSARLAFYFFFALFPLLLLLMLVLGKTVSPGSDWRGSLLDALQQILPLDVSHLLGTTVEQLNASAFAGTGAIVGAVSALWGTLNGTLSIITGLDNAYEIEESRPWWRVLGATAALTSGLCLLALLTLAAIRYTELQLGNGHGSGHGDVALRQGLVWALTLTLHFAAFALLYRFGPSVKDRRWRWSIPGATLATALWAAFTFLLRLYQPHAGSAQRVYGGLNAVSTLLLWFYLVGAAIYMGAEANAVIAKASREGAKLEPR